MEDLCQHPGCNRSGHISARLYEGHFWPNLIVVCKHHWEKWLSKDEKLWFDNKRPVRLHGWKYEPGVKWMEVRDGKWVRIPKDGGEPMKDHEYYEDYVASMDPEEIEEEEGTHTRESNIVADAIVDSILGG